MQFLLFLPTEGFTNQLVAILHAAVFAKALNFTLVIPSLYSRTAMVRSSQVKDVEDPGTFRRLPFATFYDTQIFIQRMSALGVCTVELINPTLKRNCRLALSIICQRTCA